MNIFELLRKVRKQIFCRWLVWHAWDEQRSKQENPDGSFSYSYHARCDVCDATIDLEIDNVMITVEKVAK